MCWWIFHNEKSIVELIRHFEQAKVRSRYKIRFKMKTIEQLITIRLIYLWTPSLLYERSPLSKEEEQTSTFFDIYNNETRFFFFYLVIYVYWKRKEFSIPVIMWYFLLVLLIFCIIIQIKWNNYFFYLNILFLFKEIAQ